MISLVEASLRVSNAEGRVGNARETIHPRDKIPRQGLLWKLANDAVDFGGVRALADFRELVLCWRDKPWISRRVHHAVRASQGVEDSEDERARRGQKSTPRRHVMGAIDPNGRGT